MQRMNKVIDRKPKQVINNEIYIITPNAAKNNITTQRKKLWCLNIKERKTIKKIR